MFINLLVIFFTIFGIREILFSKNGHDESLKWIIFAFILGYRTFEPFPGFKIHPIEIFVYAGILKIMITNIPKYSRIPENIYVLSLFFFSFFIIDCLTRYNPNILFEFKNAILLLLIFFVVQHIQIRKVYIIKLLKIYLFSASTISILGIMEFLFPSFMAFLFGYQVEFQSIDNLVFNRLAFLFWGSHLAANLIPPVFSILLLLKSE